MLNISMCKWINDTSPVSSYYYCIASSKMRIPVVVVSVFLICIHMINSRRSYLTHLVWVRYGIIVLEFGLTSLGVSRLLAYI